MQIIMGVVADKSPEAKILGSCSNSPTKLAPMYPVLNGRHNGDNTINRYLLTVSQNVH